MRGNQGNNQQDHDVDAASLKKRKTTYTARKEEKAALEKVVAELQEQIQIQEAAQHVATKSQLHDAIASNVLLATHIEANALTLAGAQSMLSAQVSSQPWNPLDHFIHLPENEQLRRRSLLSLKSLKINTATRLIRERMRFQDIRQSHRHYESTVLENGDYVISVFDVTPFEGISNVRLVFDEFQRFVNIQEISVLEHLGVLSTRELDDWAQSAIAQFRVLTAIDVGADLESNLAMFSQFVDSLEEAATPTYGIGTVDYVDQDDRHPYQPATRMRKDISACVLITQTFPDLKNPFPGVSMARIATIRLHAPRFPISEQIQHAARENAEAWCEVMPKVMRERLGLR